MIDSEPLDGELALGSHPVVIIRVTAILVGLCFIAIPFIAGKGVGATSILGLALIYFGIRGKDIITDLRKK